ncbi:hypothetical protein, partial [Acidilobus sp.]|uniref:hypothetical protein n=1 Tax=Acidilobus sp. TaxID=1872109 RepID=UPI003CFD2441
HVGPLDKCEGPRLTPVIPQALQGITVLGLRRPRLPGLPVRENLAAIAMFAAAVLIALMLVRLSPIIASRIGAPGIAITQQRVTLLSCGAVATQQGMLQVYAIVYNNGTSGVEVSGAYLYDSAGFEDASNTTQVYIPPRHYVPITMYVMALNQYEPYTVTVFTASGYQASCQFTYGG